MNVLMISFDHTMLLQGDGVPSDTRERHIKYAAALQQRYPGSHLTILVKVPPSMPAEMVQLSRALTLYPIPCRRALFPIKAWQTARTIFARERYDLVTTQSPFDDGLVGVWLKRTYGVSLNVQMRSSFLDFSNWIQQKPFIYRVFNVIGKWVSCRADTIRVVSYGEKERLGKNFPSLKGKVVVLQPLVNIDTFYPPVTEEEKEHVRQELFKHGLQDTPFLLFVGRMTMEKNLLTLLKAFVLLKKKRQHVALIMAGDGVLRKKLELLAADLGLGQSVVWLGNLRLSALRGWYALARGTMLPSWQEGIAKTLMESYLMETPLIITPFVSAQELIEDSVTGFITRSFTDPGELAEIMKVFVDAPEFAQEMGEKGREHILKYLFQPEEYMTKLIDIWKDTLSN